MLPPTQRQRAEQWINVTEIMGEREFLTAEMRALWAAVDEYVHLRSGLPVGTKTPALDAYIGFPPRITDKTTNPKRLPPPTHEGVMVKPPRSTFISCVPDVTELRVRALKVPQLRRLAAACNIRRRSHMDKGGLIFALLRNFDTQLRTDERFDRNAAQLRIDKRLRAVEE